MVRVRDTSLIFANGTIVGAGCTRDLAAPGSGIMRHAARAGVRTPDTIKGKQIGTVR